MANGDDEAIERLCEEHDELIEHLLATGKITWKSRADDQFAKALLLAVASRFEARLTDCVVEMFESATRGSDALVSFVQKEAVERRYHTWFDWNANTANKFFRSFGEEFKNAMAAKVKNDPDLDDAVRAFLELGRLRNELAHEDYATFSMQKTPSEVLERYRAAARFVDWFAGDLQEHVTVQQAGSVC